MLKPIFAVFLVTLVAGKALAQERLDRLPEAGQIRAFYSEREENWPPLPPHAVRAFAVVEDRHFFTKPHGPSTVSRRVAFWLLEPDTTRARQRHLGITIDTALSREEVAFWYASEIFLGHGCYGLADAASAYFGKTPEQLHLGEVAFLARLAKAPLKMAGNARSMGLFGLEEMLRAGVISAAQRDAAASMTLEFQTPIRACPARP